MFDVVVEDNSYSEGDLNPDSAPIILPPKKIAKKKSKNNIVNPKHVEDGVELHTINTTGEVEGYIE
ncbi:hypothetical protein OROHE_018018 [Orobanche hederae]